MRHFEVFLTLLALLVGSVGLASQAAAQIIMPPQDYALNHTQIQFGWPKVDNVDEYQVEVYVDNGAPDPFMGETPVADVTFSAIKHRGPITTGMVWGEDYVWRVRSITAAVPGAWGATYRFSTLPLPAFVPIISTTTTGMGPVEPGLTLFNIRSPAGTVPNGLALVVDEAGNVVWFLDTVDKKITDIRQIHEDRMQYIASDRAWEVMLNGQVAWVSPLQADMRVHHEAFRMPNNNVLILVHDYQIVNWETSPSVFEDVWFKGDRLIELNRDSNAVVWQWSTWDHYSTLDFDATEIAVPTVGIAEPGGSSYPWTHGNSVVYEASTDSIYFSARNLNRITRIDRSTKTVDYDMGFLMPSGEAEFGDDLFSFQHAPEMQPNGNMLLYDNGNRRGHVNHNSVTGVSKAIELSFTGNPPTSAAIAWSWDLPEFQRVVGDVDHLDTTGNRLVVGGNTGHIYEVSNAGDIVWQLDLPGGNPDFVIYRAERLPALISDTQNRDTDGDGITDFLDNCPDHENVGQVDRDGDGFGDTCARAYGVGVFALPSLSPVGFALLIAALIAVTLAAMRVRQTA